VSGDAWGAVDPINEWTTPMFRALRTGNVPRQVRSGAGQAGWAGLSF